eukprot:TRINITY_DN7044_c1_g1_i6.p1 TRINITY_DN7044_c1_g1~~TRINITY_DN7044_c1_g1_i6.p1  ORF type:complete len:1134 (-),score=177.53 TRINITY_DN7044_c1_g1_i6:90-3491(-)
MQRSLFVHTKKDSMADALVSFVVKELYNVAKDEFHLLNGVKKEVDELSSTYEHIKAALVKAERQQLTDQTIPDRLEKLKEVVYEVEDILDSWRIAAFRSQRYKDDIRSLRKVSPCLLFPCLFFKQVNIAHRIREVRERLSQISSGKAAIGFKEVKTEEVELSPKMKSRETGSLIIKSEIFDRDCAKRSIINELVSREQESVSIVSIVGMPGLGKTTLAQLVCDDEEVIAYFEKRIIWVWVSEPFDVNKIARKVIESMSKSTSTNADADADLHTLQQTLTKVVGERFLLVLDDVWNDDVTLWEKLRVPLASAVQGSKIMVTTRSHKVAEVMGTAYTHDLDILSNEDCWKLFASKAFKGWKEDDRCKVTEFGEKIVERCRGIPLVVSAIGNSLCYCKAKSSWERFSKMNIWKWNLCGILPNFLLSYYKLPLHLKLCFSFCSIFPKGHEMKKNEIVKLWMSLGIIRSGKEGVEDMSEKEEIEEIGERYFDDLLKYSFFQDATEDDDRIIVQCKMHDLVHDLANFVTAGDYSNLEIGHSEMEIGSGCHHLSLLMKHDVSSISFSLSNGKRLRTLLLLGASGIKEIHDSLFDQLRFLRALDLSGTSINILPSSIRKLKHLRYLSLCKSQIKDLPEFVTDLCNLQTLKLNGCQRLCTLPNGMRKLLNLRHLEVESTPGLVYLPHGLGSLTSLKTLSKFPVGDGTKRCNLGELKTLKLLSGSLEIQNLERAIDEEARKAVLNEKCNLHSLSLHCVEKRDQEWGMLRDEEMARMQSVFEGLEPPHSKLKQLQIINYVGSMFPTWLEDSKFSSLVRVTLKDCRKCRQLPGLGKLRSLKYLKINGAHEVKEVGVEFYGNGDDTVGGSAFPKLEELYFYSMSTWQEWKLTEEYGEVMPSLKELEIFNCHKLKALPTCLPNTLRKVVIRDCNELTWTPSNLLPHLETLSLSDDVRRRVCPLSLPCLPALKTLEIRETFLEVLSSEGWKLCESFHTLKIYNCLELKSLPDGLGHLKALRTLDIKSCSQLTSLPDGLGQLKMLHTIMISSCNGFTSLFNGCGQFKALRGLCIDSCDGLRPEQLKSLRSLNISDCPKLRSLPTLQATHEELRITKCPLVANQLEKEKGEGWRDISHIPSIEIDGKKIQ